MNNWDIFTEEAKAIILDDRNWSKEYMMESCALCKKPFEEHYVPLIIWKNNGHWSMSFHMKCAFGDKVIEHEDNFLEEDDF